VTGRVAAIVAALAARPRQSLTEVARAVGLPLSTTRRLLCGLVDGTLVDRTVEGRYQLGLVGLHAWAGPASLTGHIAAAVVDLTDVTGRSVRFGVWHERGVSCLGWIDPRGKKSAGDNVLPMNATAMGTMLLALTTSETRHDGLAVARPRRAAIVRRELPGGHWGIAAPVCGPTGVVAALEIVGRRLQPDLEGFTPALVYAARALGRQLSDHPALLPPGVGAAPLRWPVDPASVIGHDRGRPGKGPGRGVAPGPRHLVSLRTIAVPRPRTSTSTTSADEESSTWQT
jgi:DNA-binding IclR family transcriptional regulator